MMERVQLAEITDLLRGNSVQVGRCTTGDEYARYWA